MGVRRGRGILERGGGVRFKQTLLSHFGRFPRLAPTSDQERNLLQPMSPRLCTADAQQRTSSPTSSPSRHTASRPQSDTPEEITKTKIPEQPILPVHSRLVAAHLPSRFLAIPSARARVCRRNCLRILVMLPTYIEECPWLASRGAAAPPLDGQASCLARYAQDGAHRRDPGHPAGGLFRWPWRSSPSSSAHGRLWLCKREKISHTVCSTII
jgi:hypothetical protein